MPLAGRLGRAADAMSLSPVGWDVTLSPMALEALVTRDEETGIAYLRLADIGPGQAVRQEIVSLSDDPDNADLVLDFNAHGQLLGIEFLNARHLPPGA